MKHLVNIAQKPDSLSVKKYYNNNNEAYLEDEKYTVREIKVFDRDIADSLLVEIKSGVDFSSLAKRQGKIGLETGEFYGPFTKKQNAKYFDAASLLEINETSPVIASTSSNFAIIQLVEKFPEEPVDLKKVYVQIESFLTKSGQDNSKERNIDSLTDKYNISRNTSLLYKK